MPGTFPHRIVELEWFPYPADEYESSLDALEREEEAHMSRLRAIANASAPEPIGVAYTASGAGGVGTTTSSSRRDSSATPGSGHQRGGSSRRRGRRSAGGGSVESSRQARTPGSTSTTGRRRYDELDHDGDGGSESWRRSSAEHYEIRRRQGEAEAMGDDSMSYEESTEAPGGRMSWI